MARQRSRFKIVLILLSPILVYSGFRCAKLAVGDYGSGQTETAANVPYVGRLLTDLETDGRVAYSFKCHPHGGGTCTLSGSATAAAIETFCEKTETSMSLDGNFIASREETIEKLRREFDSKTVHGWDGEVDNSSMILICFAKHFHKLYGIHDPNTEKFVIYFQFVEPRQKTE